MFYEYYVCVFVLWGLLCTAVNCVVSHTQALIYITLKSTALINGNQSCNILENTGKQTTTNSRAPLLRFGKTYSIQ